MITLAPAIPWGSFLSTVAEWHYLAGGLALGFALGLYAEHWYRRVRCEGQEGNDQ